MDDLPDVGASAQGVWGMTSLCVSLSLYQQQETTNTCLCNISYPAASVCSLRDRESA